MKYHITDRQTAAQLNRQEAITRGCDGSTRYWWPWKLNPVNPDECALVLPDDYLGELETVSELPEQYNTEEEII